MSSRYTREELEALLGPSDDFIPTMESRKYLALWAAEIGMSPIEIYSKSIVELANIYHEKTKRATSTPKPTDIQRLSAEITFTVLKCLQQQHVSGDTIRAIVKEELSQQAPRRIEIVTPHSSVILDGPLHYMTEKVIKIAALNHPIMLVGPAGCGKTTIGNHVAKALGLQFYITSTINETHELTGFVDGRGEYHRTPFRDAFEHGGVWIADEIDAWDASALLAANAALANGYAVFPDSPCPINRHANFRMIATANTFGHGADRVYVGRNQLDAATLDRFATLDIDYDLVLERAFANGNDKWLEHIWSIRKAVDEKKIRHVVSSRAIIMGAMALNSGLSWDDCNEIYLFKGMSKRDREKID